MLALISTLVLAQFSPPLDDNGEWRVEGRCTYPPALVEQAGQGEPRERRPRFPKELPPRAAAERSRGAIVVGFHGSVSSSV